MNGNSMSAREESQSKRESQVVSPPPHVSTFRNALTDYSSNYETVPDVPPRGYETKGKLYTVPEVDSFMTPQKNVVNWDDSDAEERVLKEIQHNREREKQRQQLQQQLRHQQQDEQQQQQSQQHQLQQHHQLQQQQWVASPRDRKNATAENQGFVPSPKSARSKSSESTLEKWTKANESKSGTSLFSHKQSSDSTVGLKNKQNYSMDEESIVQSVGFPAPEQQGRTTSMIVRETSVKKYTFYFEEGNRHFLEVEEDDVHAYLPEKIDKLEKIFRQVWREIFSGLRIVTSFFILFIVEFILFLAHHVIRPLLFESVKAVGDFVLKPFLTLLNNSFIQPFGAFVWHTLHSIFSALDPLMGFIGAFLSKISIVVSSFRLFVISNSNSPSTRNKSDMDII